MPNVRAESGEYMQITDRSKDVIKSGGEWIVDLENIAMGHPAVAIAACIAANHCAFGVPVRLSAGCSAARPAPWPLLAALSNRAVAAVADASAAPVIANR
jgi:acyl-CoA synthetase (AMP-forming)/AMP-acid ligase II